MELKWLEVAVNTTAEEMEALAGRLTLNGVTHDESDIGIALQHTDDFVCRVAAFTVHGYAPGVG